MLKTEKEKRICEEYSTPDCTGQIHCGEECPLSVETYPMNICKRFYGYDETKKEWIRDYLEE